MEGSSSQPEISKDSKEKPKAPLRPILQSENKNAQSWMPVETEEPENAQISVPIEQEVTAKDLSWYTPPFKAAINGDWESARDIFGQRHDAFEQEGPANDISWYTKLFKAAINGDQESARDIFGQRHDAFTAGISVHSITALHMAVGTGSSAMFLRDLLTWIPTEALVNLRDLDGDTALHYAATTGNVEAAKLLVCKDPRLTNMPNTKAEFNSLPIHYAALYANKDMVSYLLTVTGDDTDPNPFAEESGLHLLNHVILAEFYDLALYLVQLYPSLATLRSSDGETALEKMAGKPSELYRRSSLPFWHRLIYYCVPANFGAVYSQGETIKESAPKPRYCAPLFQQLTFSGCKKRHWVFWKVIEYLVPQARSIRDARIMDLQGLQLVKRLCKLITDLDYTTAASMFERSILLAASLGNVEIVEEILEFFPMAIWSANEREQTIFAVAVANRRESVFNLLYQVSGHKKWIMQDRDLEWNTILHLAARLAPPAQLNRVSGAALQMQRELQWYKEAEKHVQPSFKYSKNKKERTPAAEFSEEHKDLMKEGEKWMKDTANSCTFAAALIATIAFAASITVPGGDDGDSGFPIFSNNAAFNIFSIFDVVSLFSATASMLMFLSILTARYAEGDFLYSLPRRLIIGLFTLFLSITSMMVAFGATIYLVFGRKKAWTLIPVATLACLPVTLFVTLQFPLLLSMFRSTYFPGFGKQSERLLF